MRPDETSGADLYLLDALANDVEDIDGILRLLNSDSDFGWHVEWGRHFDRNDVLAALTRLVQEGHVQRSQGEWCEITEHGRLRHRSWKDRAND